MMAANNSELQQLLLRYINSRQGRERMREVLQTTSVEVRYNTLMSVRGGQYQYTAVHVGAQIGDLDSLKCMLSGFTSDQWYNIVKEGDNDNDSAVQRATVEGHTDIIMFLLSKLSLEQRFNILRQQSCYISTPLHIAAKNKHTSVLQAVLTAVSPSQQEGLLNIKDGEGKTIADIIPLPELPYDVAAWTKMGLDVASLELAEMAKQQKVNLTKQREDNAKQVEQQTKELRDANQKTELLRAEMNERMEAIEKLCEKFVKQGQELKVEMDKQNEANEKLGEKCEQQGQELGKARQKIEVLEADKAQLSEELMDTKQKMDGIEAEVCKQREDNAKLSERCEQQGQELSDAKEQIAKLMTSDVELRMDMSRQARDQDIIVDHKLEASNKEQKATSDQLRAELDRQREENAELAERAERYEMETVQEAQELRSLVDRQDGMENVMEEMERLLRQPVVIGPEMDQEYEDH